MGCLLAAKLEIIKFYTWIYDIDRGIKYNSV